MSPENFNKIEANKEQQNQPENNNQDTFSPENSSKRIKEIHTEEQIDKLRDDLTLSLIEKGFSEEGINKINNEIDKTLKNISDTGLKIKFLNELLSFGVGEGNFIKLISKKSEKYIDKEEKTKYKEEKTKYKEEKTKYGEEEIKYKGDKKKFDEKINNINEFTNSLKGLPENNPIKIKSKELGELLRNNPDNLDGEKLLTEVNEKIQPLLEQLRNPGNLEKTYVELYNQNPQQAENFKVSLRTVVSQSPEFAKDIEFKTRIENLSSLVQAKLQTTDMKGIRPIDNGFAKTENGLDTRVRNGKNRSISLPISNTSEIPVGNTDEEDRKINEIQQKYDEKIITLENELNATKNLISTLDSIILASEKVENKDNFLKFAKNLLIERIKELGIDKFKDGINSINNVDDLKTLKSTFEEYFAEKDKELQRLKKEKDAELKKTNTEIYLNKQELKEKQRDALQILHSLFLDRFGTEFLTGILDFLNTTEIIENFQLRPNNIQEGILGIEGVSSNFDENAFAKLIQVINIGFFGNDSTVKLEISEENNKNINFIKNGEFLTEDTEKVLIIKNKLGDNPIRSFKYNLEGYKKEEMS